MRATEIIGALPTLNPTDLQAIRGAADALLGPQGTPLATPLFDAMVNQLGLNVHYAMFAKTGAFKFWRQGEREITKFIENTFPPLMRSKVGANAIQRHLMELLIVDLREQGVPLMPGVVARNLVRIPHCFEKAYPGYIASGAVHLIMGAMTRGKFK